MLILSSKDRLQFVRWNDLKLRIRTVTWFFVRTPSSKVRHVAKTVTLHVFVSNFNNQLGSEWLPRQILPTTPATLPARHATRFMGFGHGPLSPRMRLERVFAIRLQKFNQFDPFLIRKTR